MASETTAKKKIAGLLSGAPKGGNLPRGLLSKGSMSKYTPTMREKIAGLLAKNWYGDTREGYRQAEKLVNVGETVVPPLGLLSGSYDAGRALGGGNMMQAGVLGGLAMLPLPGAAKKGIRAYHGSPHSFDKFSMDKIGTGEGAQAYGHGLYFAEGEGVAKSYRDSLSDTKDFTTDSGKRLPSWVAKNITGYDFIHNPSTTTIKPNQIAEIRADFQQRLAESKAALDAGDWNAASRVSGQQEILDALDDIEKGAAVVRPGHMYEVNIDADPDQFLDWDKPIADQPEVYNKIEQLVPKDLLPSFRNNALSGIEGSNAYRNYVPNVSYPIRDNPQSPWKASNATTYEEALKMVGGDKNRVNTLHTPSAAGSSDTLKKAGIPGIKYLDAGSRAKGDGSRNYVVFDEKLISIVRKYGIAGASTMLGYDILSNVTTDQAETLKQAERVY